VTAGSELTRTVSSLLSHSSTPISSDHAARLGEYLSLLLRWSRRINLTGFKTAEAAVEGLLFDAVELAPLLPEGGTIVDVGAGAGGMGFTLATLREDLSLHLVEPRHKRVVFLRTAARQLECGERVGISEARAEELPESFWEPVDGAYAQAVFPPAQWLEVGLRLLKPEATLFCLTAKKLDSLVEIPEALALLEERAYELPTSGTPRVISALRVKAR
jgi:16S rRNA (guanine527-N7)-methyltransferase